MTSEAKNIPASAAKLGAIVMANGDADVLARAQGIAHKALLDLCGRSMIQRVIDPVAACAGIGRLVVACRQGGPVAEHLRGQVELAETQDARTFLDGVRAGFEAMPEVSRALLVTCDMPLLTPEAVAAAVEQAAAHTDADLMYAMVDVELTRAAYPETHRTAIRLKEGNYTAAGVCVVSRQFIQDCGPFLLEAFKQRKSKVGLARLFGLGFLARFALGMLAVKDLVKRAEQLMHCRCAAVELPFAECGFDVDSEEDLAAARQCLSRRG